MIENIGLASIKPNPWAPERAEDPQGIEELANSILAHGLLQEPLGRVIDVDGGGVELACGHRRLAAFRLLLESGGEGYRVMPVRIIELTDQQMADVAISENKQRKDLDPIAEAKFYRRYLDTFRVTQNDLAKAVGISQGELANTLRLLELPEDVKEKIISREITARHGRALLHVNRWPEARAKALQWPDGRAPSVAELEGRIQSEIRQRGKHLDEKGWPRPQFDTSGCQKCPDQTHVKGWGDDKTWVCMNTDCWEKKQQEAQDAQTQELLEKVGAGLDKEKVLPRNALPYGSYAELDGYGGDRRWHPEECDTCEHVRLMRDYNESLRRVCTKPQCFSQKKAKYTREENKIGRALTQLQRDRIARAVAAADPQGRACTLAVVRVMTRRLSGDVLRAALAVFGQPTKTEEGKPLYGVSVVEEVKDLPLEELHRGVACYAVTDLAEFNYWRENCEAVLEAIEQEAGLSDYKEALATAGAGAAGP